MNNDVAQYLRGLLNAYNLMDIGSTYPDYAIVDYVKSEESVIEVNIQTCIDKCKEDGLAYDYELFRDDGGKITQWVMLGRDFEELALKYHDLGLAAERILDDISIIVRAYQDTQRIKELRFHGRW